MKNCNDDHLQMVNQESNIKKLRDKMNSKKFNSKTVKKSCYGFLSSIVTLSILSVSNSSFAFPGEVRGNNTLILYNAPPNTDIERKKYKTERELFEYSLVDVLYCRTDKWCYISGYYSKGSSSRPDYYPERAWAYSDQLCDRVKNDYSNPLPFCQAKSLDLQGLARVGNKLTNFFCDKVEDEKGRPVANPWRWLRVEGNSNLCNGVNQ